jgi:hypothetical protein
MSNWVRIWALPGWNMDFQVVFATNMHFLVKPKENHFKFWAETQYFLKPQKIIYITIMSNQTRIWASRRRHMYFRLVFTVKRHFSVKSNADPFKFWGETQYFLKPLKIYLKHLNEIEMGITGMKYGFLVYFCHKQTFVCKTKR